MEENSLDLKTLVTGLEWISDQRIAIGFIDGFFLIYDVENKQKIFSKTDAGPFSSFYFHSADNSLFLSCFDSKIIWKFDLNQQEFSIFCEDEDFSKCNKTIHVTNKRFIVIKRKNIYFYKLSTKELLLKYNFPSKVSAFDINAGLLCVVFQEGKEFFPLIIQINDIYQNQESLELLIQEFKKQDKSKDSNLILNSKPICVKMNAEKKVLCISTEEPKVFLYDVIFDENSGIYGLETSLICNPFYVSRANQVKGYYDKVTEINFIANMKIISFLSNESTISFDFEKRKLLLEKKRISKSECYFANIKWSPNGKYRAICENITSEDEENKEEYFKIIFDKFDKLNYIKM